MIIWNDFRAHELLKCLGGKGNVFTVFDTFPSGRSRQNKKYGSTTLINSVNIVNSVQNFTEFLDTLVKNDPKFNDDNQNQSEDKGQSYRRFPIILDLKQDNFAIYVNTGVFGENGNYECFSLFSRLKGSMKTIAQKLNNNPKMRMKIENQTVQPVIQLYNQLINLLKGYQMTDDEIMDEFKDYGSTDTCCCAADSNAEELRQSSYNDKYEYSEEELANGIPF